jgi:hypothetical protein
MLDFAAYLRRIGLDAADNPSWQAVHRAHATTIPFENLDPHQGIPVSLQQADLERKLVASRRGGRPDPLRADRRPSAVGAERYPVAARPAIRPARIQARI